MANVKTSVSLKESLFAEVESLASELKTSRSKLIELALKEFIERFRSRRLAKEIDAAYAEGPSSSEHTHLLGMRRQHRQVVEGEW